MPLAIKTIVALGLLLAGGEVLVRGASVLASRLGASRLAVGATVVAFGTSAPELVVSMKAALVGSGDIALGNVVGSNIVNIGLILGLSAAIRPLEVRSLMVRRDIPLLIGATFLLIALVFTVGVNRPGGIVLTVLLAGFIWLNFKHSRQETEEVQQELATVGQAPPRNPFLILLMLVGGLGGLIFGAQLFVDVAVSVASALGMDEAAIALTVVAVGTSLPELVTSLVATARGQVDIAVGNVVGSNIFNILGIAGLTAVVQPLTIGGLGWLDLASMAAASLLLLVFVFSDRCLDRREGWILVALYGLYTWYLLAG